MAERLIRFVARLPLAALHSIGFLLGWLTYWFSPRYRRRLQENLRRSGVAADPREFQTLLRSAVGEAGKGATEIVVPWFADDTRIARLIREVHGWEAINAELQRGKGVIMITPHLGCFEMAGRFLSSRNDITFLYREPKQRWLEPYMVAGRTQGHGKLARTDLAGVRTLMRALKRGQLIGILPDQAPGAGEGVWAPFFGRNAYTMTLVGKLHQRTGAAIIAVVGERLPRSRGYRVSIVPLNEKLPEDEVAAATRINAFMEVLIRPLPAQYLWSYNRYKSPAGASQRGIAGHAPE